MTYPTQKSEIQGAFGQKRVDDWGDPASRLVLIGEAPGFYEVQQGQPFIGPSGHKLEDWWKRTGLSRNLFYIMNVYPFQPANNDITKVPKADLDYYIQDLHSRLGRLTDPYLIVPTGDTAFHALTGKKGISKHRGSILEYEDLNGRKIKVIPTLHPAGVLRKMSLEGRCLADWQKVKTEGEYKDLRLPVREHKIRPTLGEVENFKTRTAQNSSLPMTLDIETHPRSGMTCIGFAVSDRESFVIPLGLQRQVESKKRVKDPGLKDRIEKYWEERIVRATRGDNPVQWEPWFKKVQLKGFEKWEQERKITAGFKRSVGRWEDQYGIVPVPEPTKSNLVTIGYWKTQEEADAALGYVKEICEGPNPKIMQNGFYDVYWLWSYGIKVNNYAWDTLSMHHCLWPNDEHSLHYMASTLTREPYWKDEAKEPGEVEKYASNSEALWIYNGLDCTVTYEIFQTLHRCLEQAGRMDFYDRHYRQMQEPLMAIMKHGIRIDLDKMAELRTKYQNELNEVLAKINEVAGTDLIGKKKISPAKLKKYFYEDLKLPQQMRRRGRNEKTASVDEVAVRTLMLRFPQQVGPVGELYLRSQRCSQLLAFLQEARVDEDKRFRSTYKFTTTSGRLASAANPKGTGANAQNQDRDIREIFIPDEGMFLLEVDMAQIESRIVYMLTRDPELVKEAQTPPWEYDMHTANAKRIFMITGALQPGQEPTYDQRYLGKKAVHGAQRAMHGKKLADELLKEGTVLTPDEAETMIQAYHTAKPAIEQVYFREVAQEVRQSRCLTNSWGRTLAWPYDRFSDDLYREAYSFKPQADAADLLNQWGLVPLYNVIKEYDLRTRIHMQRHDALIMSTSVEEGYWIVQFLSDRLSQPVYYFGEPLSVPISVKIGMNDKDGHEWKKVPEKEEFEEVAKGILPTV